MPVTALWPYKLLLVLVQTLVSVDPFSRDQVPLFNPLVTSIP